MAVRKGVYRQRLRADEKVYSLELDEHCRIIHIGEATNAFGPEIDIWYEYLEVFKNPPPKRREFKVVRTGKPYDWEWSAIGSVKLSGDDGFFHVLRKDYNKP